MMKLSLTLSGGILLCCGWIGWRDQAAITTIAATHARLTAEAHELGLGTGDLSGKAPLPRSNGGRARREGQANREAQARAYSVKLIDFALKMQGLEKAGKANEQDLQAEALAVIDELLELDPAQLKILVAELSASTRMDDELRRGILGLALITMSERNPAGALALFSDSKDLVGRSGEARTVVTAALAKLSEQDPLKAVEWIRANGKEFPDLLNDSTRAAVLAGAAKSDPRLAFSLIDELDLSRSRTAAAGIARTATTPAARSAVLDAMRDYLGKTTSDEAKSAVRFATLSGLAETTVADGFDKSAAWLDSAHLSQDELTVYADRIMPDATGQDSAKWIAWMTAKLPPEGYTEKVGEIVDRWTYRDYRAAGSWLNDQPEGPARTAAVKAYAGAVSNYEPETAAQWALTLPVGDDRNQVLAKVYLAWKGKDAAAAETFAKQQGLGGK